MPCLRLQEDISHGTRIKNFSRIETTPFFNPDFIAVTLHVEARIDGHEP
jgi:hypothetical protein